jgi:type II secretory pathway pseudopilin PulG
MCFEILVPAIISAIGVGASTGIQASQAEEAEDLANEQARQSNAMGAQSLLEQQDYNKQQLDLQNKQLLQDRQEMDMNAWNAGGANNMLSGDGTSTTAPTSGTGASTVYGSTDNSTDIIPGANKILQQPNVYQWF